MSEATLPSAHRSERPLGATAWFVWMVAMWAGFFVLLLADRIGDVWSWVPDLPLVAELVLWVALFPLVARRSCLDGFLGWLASPPAGVRLRVRLVVRLDPAAEAGAEGRAAMSDRQVLRGLVDVAVASPLFAFAPLYRRRHLRWGATDAEVARKLLLGVKRRAEHLAASEPAPLHSAYAVSAR